MDKIIKTSEIAQKVFLKENFNQLKLSNTEKVKLIRDIFDFLNMEISNQQEGKVKVQGLGNFVIRNVATLTGSVTTRRVVFKGKEI